MLSEAEERQLLAQFVDRTDEMERFCKMLESNEKHIMVVWGDEGMGKTSLQMRMMHECAQRKLRKAEVQCGGMRTSGYLPIMQKISDDVGDQYFRAFTDYLILLKEPGYQPKVSMEINVAGGAKIEGSKVADITAIKNSTLVFPRPDTAVPEDEKMLRLTDRFLAGLAAASKENRLVVFIDAVELMSPDLKRWLWDELLLPVREGRLAGVKFVLCTQEQPKLARDWHFVVEEAELAPLTLEHIKLYLERCGVEEGSRDGTARVLLKKTKGNIAKLAEWVQFVLQLQEIRQGHE